jgi:hypothetical protein
VDRRITLLKTFLRFLAVGTVLSATEEFLTVVILRRDFGAWLFTLLVLFPAYLTIICLIGKALEYWYRGVVLERARFALPGVIGLAIEWFLIGLSPWSNPAAIPILMLLFQAAMFSFWATVGYAPWLFVTESSRAARARKRIRAFGVRWFTVVYLAALLAPRGAKFAVIVPSVGVGYMALAALCVGYFRETLSSGPTFVE